MRLTPGAGADRLLGVAADEAGLPVLRAQVTAAPENGKANAALVGLLAKRWRLPRSSITVMQGATGRRKLLRIAGEPAALARRIMEALERDD